MAARLGLGLAALGRPGYMTLGHGDDVGDPSAAAMELRCHQVLDAAVAAGIRHVDAARSYGRAEEFLASWLRTRGEGPADLVVSSKWGYTYTAGWRAQAPVHEVKEHTLAQFERQLEESRALLGQRLAIYQIHSVTPDSPALSDVALLAALARLRDSGVGVGLTVSGARQAELIDRALAVRADGRPLFGAVQATWNLHERAAGAALARAHEAGLLVMIKEPLANGRLARPSAAPDALREVADARGATPDAVALAAVLAQPFADVVLSGAVTLGQLEQNLLARGLRLGAEDWEALAGLEEPGEQYWGERGRLAWS